METADSLAVRFAEKTDLDRLASMWYDGWRDAHATIVSADLIRLRTRESFAERLCASLAETRVVGPRGMPAGFCILRDDELYQLFVSREARGAGVAAVLMADAECRLVDRGVRAAWLACAVGNLRAAAFYEKSGWRCAGTVDYEADTRDGVVSLAVWRYEKRLSPSV